MSVFSDELQAALKSAEKPAAQLLESLLLEAVQALPDLLPADFQAVAKVAEAAGMPALKAWADAEIAKLP